MGKRGALLIAGLAGALLALLAAVAMDEAAVPERRVASDAATDEGVAGLRAFAGPDPGAAPARRRSRRDDAASNEEYVATGDLEDPRLSVMGARTCDVQVTDAAGEPVRGARVDVRDFLLGRRFAGESGADGLLRVRYFRDGVHVSASLGDLLSSVVELPSSDDGQEPPRVVLPLRPGVRVRGTVVRPDGSPAAGVKVSVPGLLAQSILDTVVTDDDGRFMCSPRAPDATLRSVCVEATSDVRAEVAIDAEHPEAPVRVEIPWRVDVEGRCVTSGGRPIMNPDAPTQTLRLRLPAVASPGHADVTRYVGSAKWTATVAWNGPGPVIDLGDVVFRPEEPLRGVVLDPSGVPVAEVGVNTLPAAGQSPVFSDAAGRFAIDASSGYDILVRATLPSPPAADGTAGPPLRAWTIVDRTTIAAAIADADRAPLRIAVSPNPVARLRAVTAGGDAVAAIQVVLRGQPELSPRPRIENGIAHFALVGRGPWEIDVTAIRGLKGRITISAGDALERDVVVGE